MRRIALLLPLLLLSPCFGQTEKSRWKTLLLTPNEEAVLIDTQRIENPSGKTLKIWLKHLYLPASEDRKARPSLDHRLRHLELDCAKARIRLLSTTDYDANGKVLDSSNEEGQWDDAIPESNGEVMLQKVCPMLNPRSPRL